MLMTEGPSSATRAMAPLADLVMASHDETFLVGGQYHLMLENPRRSLRVGDAVKVTLRFAHAGEVNVGVPVVAHSPVLDGSGTSNPISTGTAVADMSGLKGM
jgi:copper(I)-binding protein